MSIAFLANLADDDLVDKNTIRSSPTTYRTALTNQTEKRKSSSSAPVNTVDAFKDVKGASRVVESDSVRQAPVDAGKIDSSFDHDSAHPSFRNTKLNGHGIPIDKAESTRSSLAPTELPASFHTALEDSTIRPGHGVETESIRSESIRTGTPPHIPPSAVGTFATGAATSGPQALPDSDLRSRATIAESNVGSKILRRLTKREAKDGKRMSRILQNEAVTEQRTLDLAIKELERLQKVQRKAAAAEAEALSTHTKASRQENKLSQTYFSAKTRWEQATAYLESCTVALEKSREHARRQTELLREKTAEVDRLRAQKATDDRERQVKLAALSNPGR
ncbi:hypothetical protein DACRYDRAFT_104600 [Dacryopinax primogenitus]|uniref:DNA binding protein Ncp1 n=1 Tax=Dacryopinax primogenitus (strain DJM 731) TaxID=1858805 RepID=M5G964_DACPD|nr:uncharacterized protein DACRYDRAFT_104600 [Dacryopinax primogenitus]EJU04725.1 hypothetical protein DACRYDRAFT_104600 [Dacryopinax primogenitus]